MEKLFKISCSKLCMGFFFALMLSGCGGGEATTGLDIPSTAYTPDTVTGIVISATSSSVQVGATSKLTAVATLYNGSTLDVTSNVTWTNSSSTVASIDSTGMATALLAGSTSISAKWGSNTSNTIALTITPLGPMSGIGWSYSGTAWSQVTDATVPNGGSVFQANAITDSQSTSASVTVNAASNGTVKFYYKVSSESAGDYLIFSIDGVESTTPVARWSGVVGWTLASFPITKGSHTLSWKYLKNGSLSANTDTVWLSQVKLISLLGGANQATTLNLTGAVTTLAGTGYSGAMDTSTLPATSTSFSYPGSVVTVGANLYVADSSSNKIRKIVIASGAVTTLAGSGATGSTNGIGTAASFNNPLGIASDGTNLYVADSSSNKIRKIVIASGAVTTLAGSGSFGSTDGTGTAASFYYPKGITSDGTNLYVADSSSNKIRKIVIATGSVTTLAGSGSATSIDGSATSASFNNPFGIASDGTNLYVADLYGNKIRKIVIASGAVTTLAGTGSPGSADGAGTAATFYYPEGITSDGTNLYVADRNSNKIRKIVIASGAVTTLAGSGSFGSTDSIVPATFNNPRGITSDGLNLFVVESSNNKIRKIVIATGVVTTLAGSGSAMSTDGTGTAASFYYPFDITTDGTNLYVADTYAHKVRQIVIATGVVTTLAGSGSFGSSDGTGTSASFYNPYGITTDGTNLYVADSFNNKIRKIVIATKVVTTLAGSGSSYGSSDGTGTSASFYNPEGITTDGTNLYVLDSYSAIRKIVISTGVVTTLAGSVTGYTGTSNGTGTSARFSSPIGITSDGTNLYVTDTSNNKIRQIVIATGVVTTLTGSGSATSADGTATTASFNSPQGITSDGSNLYVVDTSSHKIRKIQ